MIDQLRQMAIFAKTIDHGSFRGAANDLRLSPSVVSHHISQLEEHIGVPLLHRSTRKLRLTPEGERLLTAARNMLDAVEADLLQLSVSAKEPSGELRVTIPSALSQSPLTDTLAKFTLKFPRIALTLDYTDLRRELIEDGFDVAIRLGFTGKNSPTSRVLFHGKRKLVASPAFLSGKDTVTEPKDLQDWSWISLKPAQNRPQIFAHGDGRRQSFKPKSKICCSDARALYRFARAGAGLAVVPDYLCVEDEANGLVKHLLPDWKVPSLIALAEWPASAPRHGLIRLLVDELSEYDMEPDLN